MKRSSLLVLALCVGAATAGAATENFYEGFDAFGLGPVTNVPGWESTAYGSLSNNAPAVVDDDFATSPGNALDISWATAYGRTNTIAICTNYWGIWRWSNNPVVRFSVMLYLENRKANAAVKLRSEMPSGTNELTIKTLTNSGTLAFNSTDLGVQLVTGRFANVTLYYNTSNHHVALDYNWTNVLPWSGPETAITQFNRIAFGRVNDSAATEGRVLVDDISLETFPAPTLAWWKFDGPDNDRFVEQTGLFAPTNRDTAETRFETPATDPVWDGERDARNPYGLRSPTVWYTHPALATPRTSNWTFEAIFRAGNPGRNFAFLDWGTSLGFNSTSAWIGCGYYSPGTSLYINLRSDSWTNALYWSLLAGGSLPIDNRWHHLAIVKTADQVSVYCDYDHLGTHILNDYSSGEFFFDTNSHARLGYTLNGGNTGGTNLVLDEVRFSARALDTTEFLQAGQPFLTGAPRPPSGPTWAFDVVTISGKTYRVLVADYLSSDSWMEMSNFVARAHDTEFTLPASDQPIGFLKVLRDK